MLVTIEGNDVSHGRMLSVTLYALALLIVVAASYFAAETAEASGMFMDGWLNWCVDYIGPISIAAMAVGVVVSVELMTRIKEKGNRK